MPNEAAEQQGVWLPLECNPELIYDYLCKLGLNRDQFQCVDIYGIDPDLLQMLPEGVVAVLTLFPISESSEEHRRQQQVNIDNEQCPQMVPESTWFMEQKVSNACGTIGLLHAVFNNVEHFSFRPDSFLDTFYQDTRNKTPKQKAETLSNNRIAELIHQEFAARGQSDLPEDVNNVNLHFNVLRPIDHGLTTPATFVQDAALVVKTFMDRDFDNIQFSMVALVARIHNLQNNRENCDFAPITFEVRSDHSKLFPMDGQVLSLRRQLQIQLKQAGLRATGKTSELEARFAEYNATRSTKPSKKREKALKVSFSPHHNIKIIENCLDESDQEGELSELDELEQSDDRRDEPSNWSGWIRTTVESMMPQMRWF